MNAALESKNIELSEEMTKRGQLTEVIIRSENENRAVIDSVSDVIFETDVSGKILFLNKTGKCFGQTYQVSKRLMHFW